MAGTPYKAGPFEPVSVYDAPWLALTQALDGTATWRSFTDNLMGGTRLSPQQRESYVKRMKDSIAPGNPVVGAAVDVATNPFVLLAFVMSPAGATAMRRGGGKIFGEFLRKTPVPWLVKVGNQIVDGTAAGPILNDILDDMRKATREFGEGSLEKGLPGITKIEDKIFKALDITPAQWSTPERIPSRVTRDRVVKLRMALEGKLGARDRDVLFNDPEWMPRIWKRGASAGDVEGDVWVEMKGAELGNAWKQILDDRRLGTRLITLDKMGKNMRPPSPAGREKAMKAGDTGAMYATGREFQYVELPQGVLEHKAWVSEGAFDRVIDATPGAREYFDGLREHMLERFRMNYAKEGVTRIDLRRAQRDGNLPDLLDEQKIVRQWASQRDLDLVGRDASGHDDFVGMLLSRNTRRQLLEAGRKAGLGAEVIEMEEKVRKAVRDGFAATIDVEGYMPRTSTEYWQWRAPIHHRGGLRMEEKTFQKLRPGEVTVGSDGTLTQRDATLATGRSRPREQPDALWHEDDLSEFERLFGDDLADGFIHARDRTRSSMAKLLEGDRSRPLAFLRMDLTNSLKRWERQMAHDYAVHVAPIGEEALRSQRRMLLNLSKSKEFTGLVGDSMPREFDAGELAMATHKDGSPMGPVRVAGKANERSYYRVFDSDAPHQPPGGWSRSDVLRQTELVLNRWQSTGVTGAPGSLFAKTLLPTVLGNNHHHYGWTQALVGKTQAMAAMVAKSPLMKGVLPDGWMRYLDDFSGRDPGRLAPGWAHNSAGWLYSSTLGINMASVLLNITQPFMHLGVTMGMRNVLPAYKDAMGDIARYFQKRMSMYPGKMQITSAQRREVAEAAGIQFWDETGLGGNILEDLDRLAFAEGYRKSGSKTRFWLSELPLKPFEKGEWLNRLVAVHAVKRQYAREGRLLQKGKTWSGKTTGDWEDFRADARRTVQETQFGSDPMNTPMLFMGAGGILGDFARNPLMRQFASFTLRTPLAFAEIGAKVGGGKRYWRGGKEMPFGTAGWWLGDTVRAMGISAALYEGYKNFGLDPTNIGIVPAMTDIFGGDRILERNSGITPIMTPPVVDLSLDFLRGTFGDEHQLFGDALARMFPGGVAIQRALGVAPQASNSMWNLAGLPSTMQRKWADWKNPNAEGLVPVYKGDGSLVDFQRPRDLIMQGMGIPVAAGKEAAKFDRYLQQNRDRILGYRRDILNAYLANNPGKARRLINKFEREFSIPFTVTKRQLKDRIKSKTIPRTERMLDRLPVDARDMYLEMAASQAPRLAVPEDVFRGENRSTATKRHQGGQSFTHALPEAKVLEELKKRLATKEQQRRAGDGSYSPYDSY